MISLNNILRGNMRGRFHKTLNGKLRVFQVIQATQRGGRLFSMAQFLFFKAAPFLEKQEQKLNHRLSWTRELEHSWKH